MLGWNLVRATSVYVIDYVIWEWGVLNTFVYVRIGYSEGWNLGTLRVTICVQYKGNSGRYVTTDCLISSTSQ